MVSGFIEAREQFVEALVTEAQSRPQLYEASVDDDAVKPGPQVRVPFERVQRKKRRQERVLHGVGAVGFDAKNAAGNAGHLRPFWYCAATGEWSVLAQPDGDGDALADLPLGVDDSISFSEVEVVLGRGDLVLFYTDALTEAADADGRLLGEAGFLELVRSLLKIPGSMGAT
jgi:hypothetical protein